MAFPLPIDMFLQGFFFLLLFVTTVYSVVLGYHWFTYGASQKTAMTAAAIYLAGTFFFFGLMGFFLIA